jgi:hypothetical protein
MFVYHDVWACTSIYNVGKCTYIHIHTIHTDPDICMWGYTCTCMYVTVYVGYPSD